MSGFSVDDDVVVGIDCVNADGATDCPPPCPATPPPAPISPPLSSPTVLTAVLANTVLDTAAAVIADTTDVLCDILGKTTADDCVTAAG